MTTKPMQERLRRLKGDAAAAVVFRYKLPGWRGWCLVVLGSLSGCVGPGAVPVQRLRPEYAAPPARDVKTFDLTKLARSTEAQVRLQPGDFLEVICANLFRESNRDTKESETIPLRVGADGTVSLPLLPAPVNVGSLTIGEAEQTLRDAYRTTGLIQQPRLTLKMVEPRKCRIYVVGAVTKPGIYELRPDHCDPLRAIAAAEGLSEEAGTLIEIRRASKNSQAVTPVGFDPQAPAAAGQEQIVRLDLANDIAVRPDQLQLQNGDVVSVEKKKKRPIYVTGSVKQPGEFALPVGRDLRVLEAIGMAGGVLTDSDPNNVLLTRRLEGKKPVVVHIKIVEAGRHPEQNIRLAEGDVINVMEDWASQARKYIRQFIHFGIAPTIP